MELMPGWWIRVQRHIATHFSAQRQLAAALTTSSSILAMVPIQEINVLRNGCQLNLNEDWQSSNFHNHSKMSTPSFLHHQVSLPAQTFSAAFGSRLHGNCETFKSRLMSGGVWQLLRTDGLFSERLERFQSKVCRGRSLHASAVQADTQKTEGATGILKTVGEMIDYCNTCRSKGSDEEALRILETAEQAASHEHELTRKQALWMIQLAKAAVRCDRCDYHGALDDLGELTAHQTDPNHSDSSLYSLHNLSVAAKVSAGIIRMMLSQDAEARRILLALYLDPPKKGEDWGKVQDLTGVGEVLSTLDGPALFRKLSVRYPACPFIEARELEVLRALQELNYVLFDAERPRDPTAEKRNALNDVITKLDALLSKASAISGDSHPRVALVLCLLGRVYARFAQLPGQTGLGVMAEAAFKKALQILEAPRVASSGAYSEAVNVTKALLVGILRRDSRRASEADRVAKQVVDQKLLREDVIESVYLEPMSGRIVVSDRRKSKAVDGDQKP